MVRRGECGEAEGEGQGEEGMAVEFHDASGE
jgi:hypothetical protein